MAETITIQREDGVVTVILNRPDSHNALNPQMISELTGAFQDLAGDETIRLIILTGRGRSFCAGADLSSMRATADYDFEENMADGQRIFDLMWAVDSCPKPVIGRINGSAVGGGVGLVSCCDIVVAVERARFGFSETRLGIVPAVISPFVLAKIGLSQARQLFLTGERFDAHYARQIGLVHHVVPEEQLDGKIAERVAELFLAAPGAQAAAKGLVQRVANRSPEELREYTSELIALRRASAEGREGMSAFLEKRPPKWQRDEHRPTADRTIE